MQRRVIVRTVATLAIAGGLGLGLTPIASAAATGGPPTTVVPRGNSCHWVYVNGRRVWRC